MSICGIICYIEHQGYLYSVMFCMMIVKILMSYACIIYIISYHFSVIDFCQTKVMTVDPITKYMSLKLEWASHVNCEQRAGRVGRIGNGRVYRLVPRTFYNVSFLLLKIK